MKVPPPQCPPPQKKKWKLQNRHWFSLTSTFCKLDLKTLQKTFRAITGQIRNVISATNWNSDTAIRWFDGGNNNDWKECHCTRFGQHVRRNNSILCLHCRPDKTWSWAIQTWPWVQIWPWAIQTWPWVQTWPWDQIWPWVQTGSSFVRLFVRLLPKLWTRYFENESTDFDVNWRKCLRSKGIKRPTFGGRSQWSRHTRTNTNLESWRMHHSRLPWVESVFRRTLLPYVRLMPWAVRPSVRTSVRPSVHQSLSMTVLRLPTGLHITAIFLHRQIGQGFIVGLQVAIWRPADRNKQ